MAMVYLFFVPLGADVKRLPAPEQCKQEKKIYQTIATEIFSIFFFFVAVRHRN